MTHTDTITALATAPGASAFAVVRLSGADAVEIADRVFRGRRALASVPARTVRHGFAHDAAGEAIDEVTAVVFRSSSSPTGEDAVEFTCHGGDWAAPRLIAALVASGSRIARPGEFTERAFLAGKIDLAQAEAIADVIHAESLLAARLAARQIEGGLSRSLAALAELLRDGLAEVEARVDFSEDVGGEVVPDSVRGALQAAAAQLETLLAGSDLGRRAREGARVVLVGRPNAGKSSLFNALLGEERAIVTPTPGTTRDAVHEKVDVGGIPVRLVDTAGVRDASGVEALGVERTRREIEGADLVVWVVDSSSRVTDEDLAVFALLRSGPYVLAWAKSDLPGPDFADCQLGLLTASRIDVSAVTGKGLADLREAIRVALVGGAAPGATALVTNTRHIEALRRAGEALAEARQAAAAGIAGEAVAGEIRLALEALGEVTGEAAAPDLLERIFARFCIGK